MSRRDANKLRKRTEKKIEETKMEGENQQDVWSPPTITGLPGRLDKNRGRGEIGQKAKSDLHIQCTVDTKLREQLLGRTKLLKILL